MRQVAQVAAGQQIGSFASAAEAAKITGIDPNNIRKCLKGLKKSAGGYKWVYEAEFIPLNESDPSNTVWLWYFPNIHDQLMAIIVEDYNRTHKSVRTVSQLNHILPKYLYLPYLLLINDKEEKVINSHMYAKITCDSPNNFKNVVSAWQALDVIKITNDAQLIYSENGNERYRSRTYALTEGFRKQFKTKRYFTAEDGEMIRRMIETNRASKPMLDLVQSPNLEPSVNTGAFSNQEQRFVQDLNHLTEPKVLSDTLSADLLPTYQKSDTTCEGRQRRRAMTEEEYLDREERLKAERFSRRCQISSIWENIDEVLSE